SADDLSDRVSFQSVVTERVNAEDGQRFAAFIDEIRRTRKEQNCEVRLVKGVPVPLTIKVTGIPEVSQHTSVSRIFYVVQDITEFREAERHLTRTTERLQRSQGIGRSGDFDIALHTNQIKLSQAALGLLDLQSLQESTIGLDGFYRQIYHEDQES